MSEGPARPLRASRLDLGCLEVSEGPVRPLRASRLDFAAYLGTYLHPRPLHLPPQTLLPEPHTAALQLFGVCLYWDETVPIKVEPLNVAPAGAALASTSHVKHCRCSVGFRFQGSGFRGPGSGVRGSDLGRGLGKILAALAATSDVDHCRCVWVGGSGGRGGAHPNT